MGIEAEEGDVVDGELGTALTEMGERPDFKKMDEKLDAIIEGLPQMTGDERLSNALLAASLMTTQKVLRATQEFTNGSERRSSRDTVRVMELQLKCAQTLQAMGITAAKGAGKGGGGGSAGAWARRGVK